MATADDDSDGDNDEHAMEGDEDAGFFLGWLRIDEGRSVVREKGEHGRGVEGSSDT